jgi:hypothetical protein
MTRARIELDYIETNGFWAKDGKTARKIVRRLRDEGMTVLMLSLCPYHAAYVPLASVRRALEACDAEGVPTFVWQDQFAKEVMALGDETKTHGLDEYEAMFPGALDKLPARFGASLLGRAAVTHANLGHTPTADILRENRPCQGPLRTGHFHVDCFGDLIPPGCPGMAIRVEDAPVIDEERQPASAALLRGGVLGLYEAAVAVGFQPRDVYESACSLCQHARTYLAREDAAHWQDLRPRGFYDELPLV